MIVIRLERVINEIVQPRLQPTALQSIDRKMVQNHVMKPVISLGKIRLLRSQI